MLDTEMPRRVTYVSVSYFACDLIGWQQKNGVFDFRQGSRLVQVFVVELVGQYDQRLDEHA